MSLRRFDTIIFDWDGTLIMSMHALLRAFKTVLIRQGLMFTDQQVIRYMFGNWLEGLRYWGVNEPEKTLIEIRNVNTDIMKSTELYPGVRDTLAKLSKRGKEIAVINLSGSEAEVKTRLNLDQVQVFTSKQLTGRKPEARVLEGAIELLGSKKADTLWVGNSLNDWEMGELAGVETVIFYPLDNEIFGNNRVIDAETKGKVIREFKELAKGAI